MRVFSFQTPDVLDILQHEGVYYADIKLCREHADYSRDIARLGGKVPIWVFTKMRFDDVASSMFTYRCEMGIDIADFCKLVMIELEIDIQPLIGLTHNSYDYACIIDSIRLSQLVMAYSLHSIDDWYFMNISRIDGLVVNQLTPSFPSFYDTSIKGIRGGIEGVGRGRHLRYNISGIVGGMWTLYVGTPEGATRVRE